MHIIKSKYSYNEQSLITLLMSITDVKQQYSFASDFSGAVSGQF